MFGSLGLPEILVILVLALLIFGPKRLPEVGRTIGKGLAEFRKATTDLKRSVNAELSLEEDERPPTTRRPVQGVGRTVAEASASRELPAASADDAEDGARGAQSRRARGRRTPRAPRTPPRRRRPGSSSPARSGAEAATEAEAGAEPARRSEAPAAAPAGTAARGTVTRSSDADALSEEPAEASSSAQPTHTSG